jgi:hypothetical protein
LQELTEKLGATLEKYSIQFSGFTTNEEQPAMTFGSFVTDVAGEQDQRKDTVYGKVSTIMQQIYPVAIIALRLFHSPQM